MNEAKCDELRHQMGYTRCPNCPDEKDPKPMTAEERAEKIFYEIFVLPRVIDPATVKREVCEQIQQACDEAHAEGVKDGSFKCSHEKDRDYEKGKRDGLLMAAEIVEKTEGIDRQGVADSIRKEAGEL